MRLRFLTLFSVSGLLFTGCSNEFKNRLLEKAAAFKGPFRVTGITPADGAMGVARNAAITVTFSEPIDANTVSSAFTVSPALSGVASASGKTATFTPAAPYMDFNQQYTVKLSGLKSLAGTPLDAEFTASFSVKDQLKILTRNPANGSTGVAKNAAISVTFNNELDTGTLLNGLTIKQNSNGNPVAGNITINGGKTLTFEPSPGLAVLTGYTVTVNHNIKDKGGDGFGLSDDVFTFTVQNYVNGNTDVSAAVGTNILAWGSISAVLDTSNNKLLIAGVNGATNKPALFRCNPDGQGCEYKNISAGISYTAENVTPVIYSDKLLVVYPPSNGSYMPRMLRCNLDGESCEDISVSAGGVGQISSGRPSAVVYNGELLFVGVNNWAGGRLSLFRCVNLTGSVSCTHADISTASNASGYGASAVVYNDMLFVVTEGVLGYTPKTPSLVRCNLIGSMSCAYKKIYSGLGETPETAGIADGPSPVIAPDGSLLVLATNGVNSSKLSLYRCTALMGAIGSIACSYTDISTSVGQGANSGNIPSAVIDVAGGRLLTATNNNDSLSLFNCSLSNLLSATPSAVCSHTATGTAVGWSISAVFDSVGQNLLIAASNNANHLLLHR